MKKKYLILTGLLFAWMGAQPVSAQTDVTSKYIKNADFSVTSDWVTSDIVVDGSPHALSVSEWMGTANTGGYTSGGVIQYGSGRKLNGSAVPATGPSGGTDGGCLAMTAAWGNTIVYTQDVTLPAGYYTLNYLVYNANKNSNVDTNLFGFKTGNTTYATSSSYPVGEWTTLSVTFHLSEETAGTISMGFKTTNGSGNYGSAYTPRLFVDNAQLIQWGLTATEAEPEEFTSAWIQNASFESGYNVGWTLAKNVSGSADFKTVTDYPSDGSKCANIWAAKVTSLDLYQNTLAMPAGKYKLTGDLRTSGADQITDQALYATVGGKTIKSDKITTVGTPWNGENSWNNLSLDFVLTEEGGSSCIGISSTGNGNNSAGWFQVDNIRLYYYGIDLTALHEAIDRAKKEYSNSVATTDAKETFSVAIQQAEDALTTIKISTEVAAVVNALESARQVYVMRAQPAEGFTFDYTFMIEGVGNSVNGWERNYNSQNFQYNNASNKNTDQYVKQGYVETWDEKAYSGMLTYMKSGLPVGNYTLSAYAFGNSGSGQVSLIANGKSTALSTETALYQNPSVEGVKVDESGELTFGLNIENNNWVGITNVSLAYAGCDYEDYQVLVSQAQRLLQNSMQATIKSMLEANISLTETATKMEIAQAVVNLQVALPLAKTSVTNYAYLQREIATAKGFDIDVTVEEKGVVDGTYEDAQVLVAAQALNVAVYNKVKDSYTHDYTVPATWTGSNFNTESNEHWSGTTHGYYDKWGANLDMTYNNTLTLPAGEYVLMAAGRSGINTNLTLTVEGTTVQFNPQGNIGWGISTDGIATFNASATYANGNKGYGWGWQYVHLVLAEEKEVTLTARLITGGVADWGSFSDISLKMSAVSYRALCYKDMLVALEECKPWTEAGYESYNTCKAKSEQDYADGDEIKQAIADLRAAFDKYRLENASAEHPYDMTDDIIKLADCTDNDPGWPYNTVQGRTFGKGQHWSGDVNRQYFAQNHDGIYARYQPIVLPKKGAYLLKSAVRVTTEGAYAVISLGLGETPVEDLTTEANLCELDVRTVHGRVGGTIATDGTEWESVEAGLAAGKHFANGDKGYGWVYGNLYFGANTDEELKRIIYVRLSKENNDNVHLEGNLGGVKLYYLGEKYIHEEDGAAGYYGMFGEDPVALTDEVQAADVTQAAFTSLTLNRTNPNGLVYAKAGQLTETDNVVVDGTCANLVLANGHPFAAPKAFTATKAAYSMTAVATTTDGKGFGTLCLPFEATTLAGQAYKLDQGATAGGELYATEVTTVPANTPVLVTAAGTYSAENASVAAVKATDLREGGELVGVYTPTEAPVGSYVLQKHTDKVAFYPVVDVRPTVKPFRAYIRPQGEAASYSMLSVVFGFDEETAIETVETAEGVKEVSRHDAAGVRISRPQKGLNIIRMSDGSVRKVIIK